MGEMRVAALGEIVDHAKAIDEYIAELESQRANLYAAAKRARDHLAAGNAADGLAVLNAALRIGND